MASNVVRASAAGLVLIAPLLTSTSAAPAETHGSFSRPAATADGTTAVPSVVLDAARSIAETGRVDQPIQWVETTTAEYYFGSHDPAAARNIPIYVVQATGEFVLAGAPRPMAGLPSPRGTVSRTLIPMTQVEDFGGAGELGQDVKDLHSLGTVHTFRLK